MIGIGFFAIAMLAVFVFIFVKTITSSRRLDDLEWQFKEIKQLRDRVSQLEQQRTPVREEVPSPAQPVTQIMEPSLIPSIPSQPSLQADPHRMPGMSQETPPQPSRTREEWEAFIGGKLLNRIGALALILGIGFFLKYAFDNNWISETVRVLIGAGIGIVCLAGAHRTKKSGLEIFSQGLVGAGIAILYLSSYAAFNFYQLVPQSIAMVLMSLVTILALSLGFFYDSLATAILGYAGGFLTPMLLSTGSNNELGLFAYLTLLTIALVGLTFKKQSWSVLEPLAFVGLWLYYIAWHQEWYAEDALGLTLFFVVVFWGIFFAADALRLAGLRWTASATQHPVAIVNAFAAFIALFNLIDDPYHTWMGSTTLLLALPYGGMALLLRKQTAPDAIAGPRSDMLAILLLVCATAIQFTEFATARWWTMEAVVLMVIGLGYRLPSVWRPALVLWIAAFFKFMITPGAFQAEQPIFFTVIANERFFTLLLLAVAALFGTWLLRRSPDAIPDADRRWILPVAEIAFAATLFLIISLELGDHFLAQSKGVSADTEAYLMFTQTMSLALGWMVLAVILNEWGRTTGSDAVAASSILLAGIASALCIGRGIAFAPIELLTPVLNIRVIMMLGTTALMVLFSQRAYGSWYERSSVRPAIGIAIVALVFALVTGETFDYFRLRLIDPLNTFEDAQRLQSLQQLALSGVWLLMSFLLMGYGIARENRELRVVAFGLFGITIAKIFFYDLSFLETLYRIFSFVGLGVILLAVSYAYQRYKDKIFGTSTQE